MGIGKGLDGRGGEAGEKRIEIISPRPRRSGEQLTSLGKKGAMIDIEQKLVSSTRHRQERTIFCFLLKSLKKADLFLADFV